MCAICGISFQKGSTIVNSIMVQQILCNLLTKCQARGSSATGIATVSNKRIKVIKSNLKAEEFLETKEVIRFLKKNVCLTKPNERFVQVIGHCRFPTKGTVTNNRNNHPIITKHIVGVHNGIIGNDDALFKKYKKAFDRDAEVDSEIIFKLIEKHYSTIENNLTTKSMIKAIFATNSELIGSAVCAFVATNNPNLLWVFRNKGTVSILHYKDIGMVIFASEKKYITDAVKGFSVGKPNKIPLEHYEGIGINLAKHTTRHFNILNAPIIGFA